MGGGRGGQAGVDIVLREEIQHLVEPGEIVVGFIRLQTGPAENGKRGDVDVRELEEPRVLIPYLARPLVRIVVASVEDLGQLRVYHITHSVNTLSDWVRDMGSSGSGRHPLPSADALTCDR